MKNLLLLLTKMNSVSSACCLWIIGSSIILSLFESLLDETLHNPEKWSTCQASICCRGIAVSKLTTQQHSCLLSVSSTVYCIELLCYTYSCQWSMASCTRITINVWIICYIGSGMFLEVHALTACSPACGTSGRWQNFKRQGLLGGLLVTGRVSLKEIWGI